MRSGEPSEPFVLTFAAKDGSATGDKVDTYLTEHTVGFAVDARVLEALRLSCEAQ